MVSSLLVGGGCGKERGGDDDSGVRVSVSVCVPELVGAGRRVEYYVAASRQAVPKQAGKQASKRAKARQGMNEWIEGILWLGIVAQSRMYVRRGC